MSPLGRWLLHLAEPVPMWPSLEISRYSCAWLALHFGWTVTGVETYAQQMGLYVSHKP